MLNVRRHLGTWQRLLRRVSPSRRFAHEFRIASQSSDALAPPLLKSAELMGFDYKAVPHDSDVNMLLGFIAAAHDIYSQALEGQAGGPGSVNGTMKTYQVLFGDEATERLLDKTFALFATDNENFERGRFYGSKFMNALLQGDSNTASLTCMGMIVHHYKRYCV